MTSPPLGETVIEIPLRISISFGMPTAQAATLPSKTPPSKGPATDPTPKDLGSTPPPSPETAAALAEFERAAQRPYYDERADQAARDRYWATLVNTQISPVAFFEEIHQILVRTHRNRLAYKPARHVYPWVDLRPGEPRQIASIYSGQTFDPRELIEEEFRLEAVQERLIAEGLLTPEQEAAFPFNCEHVVPQSWFDKKEPMRGDLHHLFTCESRCNSFRSNTPYFDFPDFGEDSSDLPEVVRGNCGKSDRGRFEPSRGKGAVARATLYFLLRYPGEVGDRNTEFPASRFGLLIDWHKKFPVDVYERHRNAAIEEKQGNRNPLIDFPEWADRIDFSRGFSRRP